MVESFSSSWNVPRKEDWRLSILGCNSTSSGEGEVSIFLDIRSIPFNVACICTLSSEPLNDG